MTVAEKPPMTHGEMLIFLKYLTKEEPDIAETIYKVKDGTSWINNYNSLALQSRDKLAKTYAHLENYDNVDVDEVARLNKHGMVTMILHRLTQLMPEQCQTCHKTYRYLSEDKPMVCCRRCGRGACGDCYPVNIGAGKSFFYLCTMCDKTVSTEIGVEGLNPDKHMYKKSRASKKKATKEVEGAEGVEEVGVTVEEASEEDAAAKEADESCVFLQDAVAVTDGEEANKEDDQEFEEQPRRGYNKKKTSNVKDKVCPYLKKGHCNYSLSGRKPFNGVSQCPFLHPLTCPRLLNNGNKGKYGCDGTKCGKLHPKMCPTSLNFKRCVPDCKQGFHVRNNSRLMQEKRKEEEIKRKKEEEQKKIEEERRRRRTQLLGQARTQRDTEQPRMPDLGVPPPSVSRPLTEEERQSAFLGEVRREMLRVLLTVFPGAQPMVSAPGPAPAAAPSPAGPGLGLNWAEALKLNLR